MQLKNVRRGRIQEYAEKYKGAVYTPVDAQLGHNPLWDHKADCAFPSATQNEIRGRDAANMLRNGVFVVAEGANMPTDLDGVAQFVDQRILYGPGKAANAGGVATSALEMQQNAMRDSWTFDYTEQKLDDIMTGIHRATHETADEFGAPGNYVVGANIAGFLKVANAMMSMGLI
jgi:glutamate dehydrogenase (NADP+)